MITHAELINQVEVLRSQRTNAMVHLLTIHYLCLELKTYQFGQRKEFARDKEVIIGWILILSEIGESDLRTFTKKLADTWLLDITKSPVPAEYAYWQSFIPAKGER